MAAPTTKGQGQGLAQVLSPGSMAMDLYGQQMQLREADRQRRAAEAEKAHKELSGKFSDLYKSEIFESRDTEAFINKIKGIEDKYAGQMEKIWKGTDPQLVREFNDDILDAKMWAASSKQTKEDLQKVREDMFTKNPDKYSDEQRSSFNTFIATDNAGQFQVPWDEWKPRNDIDLDKEFTERAYKPAKAQAHDMFTSQGVYETADGKFYNTYNRSTLPKEEAEKIWSGFITDPRIVDAMVSRFGSVEKAKEFYFNRLLIDDKSGSYGKMGGGGSGGFNASLMTTIDPTPGIAKEYLLGNEGEQLDYYPIQFNVTFPYESKRDKVWLKAEDADAPVTNQMMSGSVSGITVVDGQPMALVKTAQNFDMLIPYEKVANSGNKAGYDMQSIYNGVLSPNWNRNTTPAKKPSDYGVKVVKTK